MITVFFFFKNKEFILSMNIEYCWVASRKEISVQRLRQ